MQADWAGREWMFDVVANKRNGASRGGGGAGRGAGGVRGGAAGRVTQNGRACMRGGQGCSKAWRFCSLLAGCCKERAYTPLQTLQWLNLG